MNTWIYVEVAPGWYSGFGIIGCMNHHDVRFVVCGLWFCFLHGVLVGLCVLSVVLHSAWVFLCVQSLGGASTLEPSSVFIVLAEVLMSVISYFHPYCFSPIAGASLSVTR